MGEDRITKVREDEVRVRVSSSLTCPTRAQCWRRRGPHKGNENLGTTSDDRWRDREANSRGCREDRGDKGREIGRWMEIRGLKERCESDGEVSRVGDDGDG
jgi:hypothetical protein